MVGIRNQRAVELDSHEQAPNDGRERLVTFTATSFGESKREVNAFSPTAVPHSPGTPTPVRGILRPYRPGTKKIPAFHIQVQPTQVQDQPTPDQTTLDQTTPTQIETLCPYRYERRPRVVPH